MNESLSDPLAAARDAVVGNQWARGLELFKQAQAIGELAPEDLESMGEAAWFAARPDEAIEALQRAYGAYLAADKRARAAYVAVFLAREYGVKYAASASAGWLKRAKRLLDVEPEAAEHGYLYARESVLALNSGRLDEAIELARRTEDVGVKMGDPNLQAIGAVCHGAALVEKGEVAEGLSLIDDAAVAAVSGELGLYATGMVYCNTIATCCEIADFRRAADWTDAVRRWSEGHPEQPLIPGDCRVHQAEVLALRGNWAEAEESARRGADELRAFNRLYHVGEALYQIGAIRLRMGDLPAAQDAFGQASELGRDPQPGLSLLALEEGRVEASMASIRRALEEETTSKLARARLLPAFIEISLKSRDLDAAQQALDELESIATTYDAPTIRAAADFSRGAILLAAGDAKAAARSLRSAVTRWQAVEAPYEGAKAKTLIGQAIGKLGDGEGAVLELTAARATFERLGAVPDVSKADARLLELAAHGHATDAVTGVKAFLFTDIVKSTSLVEAIGDEAWMDLLRWHDQTLRALFAEHGGDEVDHAGDGFFVAFDDPAAAIRCAIAIQRTLAEHRRIHGFAPHVREGVHVTPASRSARAYRGKGVHEAARIAGAAQAGEILASRTSVEATAIRFEVSEARSVQLRGISQPVEVVAIDWRSRPD
jgi:class 3 adenylate cyclase